MARKHGSPNKTGSTPALRFLYKHFVKPFLKEVNIGPDEKEHELGIEMFFCLPNRRVVFCIATEPFTIPGPMWASQEQPYKLIPGVGLRAVPAGGKFVLRVDTEMPERNEIEFEEQVFVLSRAQLMALKEKFEVIA